MVKIIRSRHCSRNDTIDAMEIVFDTVPNLAALVCVAGDELRNIRDTYPQSTEPDLPEALMELIQRGHSIRAEGLWDRIRAAKGIFLAFDTTGNLVGCAAIRRDARGYRRRVNEAFNVSVDSAYALNWVRARDEFKIRDFYELIITTALALLEAEHTVYATATGTERESYVEALSNTGFVPRDIVAGHTMGTNGRSSSTTKLYLLSAEAPVSVAVDRLADCADFDGGSAAAPVAPQACGAEMAQPERDEDVGDCRDPESPDPLAETISRADNHW